ncbi:hypothetical protein EXS56_02120 [Candidatus Kaiserbacteria bacterium]|nr:hypothetical protein [Candidatus Kaiserbacteria bacterium]
MHAYHAVLDSETKAFLALGTNPGVMVQVHECTPEAMLYMMVNRPVYKNDFPLAHIDPATYPEYIWNWKDRTVIRQSTPPSPALRATSALAVVKTTALTHIARKISRFRMKLDTGVEMGETVLRLKRDEALRFKELGYDESRIFEFPYLVQYAEYSGLSYAAIADDILLATRMDEEVLVKTEISRVKYITLVQEGKTAADVEKHMLEFRNIDGAKTRVHTTA